jgi:hypothetical protein
MKKVVMLILVLAACAQLGAARYDLSMMQTQDVMSKDLVIGGMFENSHRSSEIEPVLLSFFLDSLTAQQRQQMLYPATAGMVTAMLGENLFGMLPVEMVRLGVPIERDSGFDVPFRMFYSRDGGAPTSSTGSVYLKNGDGAWKVAHITVNFLDEQY